MSKPLDRDPSQAAFFRASSAVGSSGRATDLPLSNLAP
ncbi:hypothetical protein I552_3414 [Mycobacterium xenopi 3993]|nr:hypothetical protein I552_3414 [Mycobacterium xenopi 3993]